MLKEEVMIYARVKTDDDEYKEELIANISKKEGGKLNIILNTPPILKDILEELGIKSI